MIIKMPTVATPYEIAAVEAKLHTLGYTTGEMIGAQVPGLADRIRFFGEG